VRSDKCRERSTTNLMQSSQVLSTEASVSNAGRGVRSTEISVIGTNRQVSNME